MAVRKIDIKMNRHNLPFNALRAFEAAARHASVTAAASELSVTHSAVSHQIKQLEFKLGVTLFHRSNRGLTITAQGQAFLPVVMQSFRSYFRGARRHTPYQRREGDSPDHNPLFRIQMVSATYERLVCLRRRDADTLTSESGLCRIQN